MQLRRVWEGGVLPCLFWKAKIMLWFWERRAHCVLYWLKFFIQNEVLRVSKRKTPKCFPAGPFSLGFRQNVYRSVLVPWNCPSPENFWLPPAFRHCYLCKTLHCKCLTVLWIRLGLDNCSITYTMTLWILTYSSEICLFKHIQAYSVLLTHIHA